MKKVVLKFGLIAGAIVAAMLLISQPLFKSGYLDQDSGFYIGISSMIVAMSLVFLGVKSFRDNQLNGAITFGKAFIVGILIASVASLMHAITWEFIIKFISPDFIEWYNNAQMDKMIEKGATVEELDKAKADMAAFAVMYENPFIRFGFTLLEIFPVGLLFTLVSAAILKKKN